MKFSGFSEGSVATLCWQRRELDSFESNESDSTLYLRNTMTVIVLATTGLLACAFYLYVVCQWMREAKRQNRTRRSMGRQTDATPETKRHFVTRSGRIGETTPSNVTAHRVPRAVKLPRDRKAGWNATERIAYQRIARSLSLRTRR